MGARRLRDLRVGARREFVLRGYAAVLEHGRLLAWPSCWARRWAAAAAGAAVSRSHGPPWRASAAGHRPHNPTAAIHRRVFSERDPGLLSWSSSAFGALLLPLLPERGGGGPVVIRSSGDVLFCFWSSRFVSWGLGNKEKALAVRQ